MIVWRVRRHTCPHLRRRCATRVRLDAGATTSPAPRRLSATSGPRHLHGEPLRDRRALLVGHHPMQSTGRTTSTPEHADFSIEGLMSPAHADLSRLGGGAAAVQVPHRLACTRMNSRGLPSLSSTSLRTTSLFTRPLRWRVRSSPGKADHARRLLPGPELATLITLQSSYGRV